MNNLTEHEKIFKKWLAEMYDRNETQTNDVEFMLSALGDEPKRILEVACGSGRILVPLARAGHNVTGIDSDEFMLARIAAKAAGLTNIKWRNIDAVSGDWGEGFDVVVLAGNILYNINTDGDYDDAQKTFITKAAGALKPGGYLYIDYNPPYKLTKPDPPSEDCTGTVGWKGWEGTDADGVSGKVYLINGKYDADTRKDSFTNAYDLLLPNGEKVTGRVPRYKHFMPLEQLRWWLRNAGFVVEWEYGNYKREPISDKTNRAVIYAKKR
jgi:SAM-dependent methyltransferase